MLFMCQSIYKISLFYLLMMFTVVYRCLHFTVFSHVSPDLSLFCLMPYIVILSLSKCTCFIKNNVVCNVKCCLNEPFYCFQYLNISVISKDFVWVFVCFKLRKKHCDYVKISSNIIKTY